MIKLWIQDLSVPLDPLFQGPFPPGKRWHDEWRGTPMSANEEDWKAKKFKINIKYFIAWKMNYNVWFERAEKWCLIRRLKRKESELQTKALHSKLLTELSGRFPSRNEYFVISEVRIWRHFFVIFGNVVVVVRKPRCRTEECQISKTFGRKKNNIFCHEKFNFFNWTKNCVARFTKLL